MVCKQRHPEGTFFLCNRFCRDKIPPLQVCPATGISPLNMFLYAAPHSRTQTLKPQSYPPACSSAPLGARSSITSEEPHCQILLSAPPVLSQVGPHSCKTCFNPAADNSGDGQHGELKPAPTPLPTAVLSAAQLPSSRDVACPCFPLAFQSTGEGTGSSSGTDKVTRVYSCHPHAAWPHEANPSHAALAVLLLLEDRSLFEE